MKHVFKYLLFLIFFNLNSNVSNSTNNSACQTSQSSEKENKEKDKISENSDSDDSSSDSPAGTVLFKSEIDCADKQKVESIEEIKILFKQNGIEDSGYIQHANKENSHVESTSISNSRQRHFNYTSDIEYYQRAIAKVGIEKLKLEKQLSNAEYYQNVINKSIALQFQSAATKRLLEIQFHEIIECIDASITKQINPAKNIEARLKLVTLSVSDPILQFDLIKFKDQILPIFYNSEGRLRETPKNQKKANKLIKKFKNEFNDRYKSSIESLAERLVQQKLFYHNNENGIPNSLTNLGKTIINNKVYKDFIIIMQASTPAEYKNAQELVMAYSIRAEQAARELTSTGKKSIQINRMAQSLLQHQFQKVFNAQGIAYQYLEDPLYQQKKYELPISQTPSHHNEILELRHQKYNGLVKGLNVERFQSAITKELIYHIIDLKDSNEVAHYLSLTLSNDNTDPEIRNLYNIFYNEQGLPRFYQYNDALLKKVKIPISIGKEENAYERETLFRLFSIENYESPPIVEQQIEALINRLQFPMKEMINQITADLNRLESDFVWSEKRKFDYASVKSLIYDETLEKEVLEVLSQAKSNKLLGSLDVLIERYDNAVESLLKYLDSKQNKIIRSNYNNAKTYAKIGSLEVLKRGLSVERSIRHPLKTIHDVAKGTAQLFLIADKIAKLSYPDYYFLNPTEFEKDLAIFIETLKANEALLQSPSIEKFKLGIDLTFDFLVTPYLLHKVCIPLKIALEQTSCEIKAIKEIVKKSVKSNELKKIEDLENTINKEISFVNQLEKINSEKKLSFKIENSSYKIIKNTSEKCRITRPPDFSKIAVWEEFQYEKIRKDVSDIIRISKNTGIPEEKIRKVKNHLFYDDHLLRDSSRKFDPDYEIAEAWDRLKNGDFIRNDLQLIEHEYYEAYFMEQNNINDYEIAHKAAQEKFPWYVNEYI